MSSSRRESSYRRKLVGAADPPRFLLCLCSASWSREEEGVAGEGRAREVDGGERVEGSSFPRGSDLLGSEKDGGKNTLIMT